MICREKDMSSQTDRKPTLGQFITCFIALVAPTVFLWVKLFNQDPMAMLLVFLSSLTFAPLSGLLCGFYTWKSSSTTDRVCLIALMVMNLTLFTITTVGLSIGYFQTKT